MRQPRLRWDHLQALAVTWLVVLVMPALTLPQAAAAQTAVTQPTLVWTAPTGVSNQPINVLSCPSVALCVAADYGGHISTTTDPAAGQWQGFDVDGSNALTGLACPSVSLCVATDLSGNVITSTAPAEAATAWTPAKIDTSAGKSGTDSAGATMLRGLACPSTTLCVAVDSTGNALVSTNPTGGAPAWVSTHIDTASSYGCTGTGLTCQPPLMGVSCPSTVLCDAVDFAGNVLQTTTSGGETSWAITPTAPGRLSSLWDLSCPTTSFCAAVSGYSGQVISWDPAAGTQFTTRTLPDGLFDIWCASASLCFTSAATSSDATELLSSTDPGTSSSTWSPTGLGGINSVVCPTSAMCLAADDEGGVAVGVTSASVDAALRAQVLKTTGLPYIGFLLGRGYSERFASPIPAQVQVTWEANTGLVSPVVVATATSLFKAPGTNVLRFTLTSAGRSLLAGVSRVKLTATATFTTATGTASTQRQLTFKTRPKPKKKPKKKKQG